MSEDEMDHTNAASQATDLFDRLRRTQSNIINQHQSQQERDDQNQSSRIDDEVKTASAELPLASHNEQPPETASENGKLSPEARRALVSLLKHGVVLAAQKSKLFDAICRYQSAVRGHLADVYLRLVLDEKTGVAFVAGRDESDADDEKEAVSLITRRTLSLYDTLLLLVLRKHYQERESVGEQRIIIDIERIEASLTPFLPLTNSMKSDRRKLVAALNKMLEKRLLTKVRGSNDRLEITPIIRYVVNAEFLEKMLKEYQGLALEAGLNMQPQDEQSGNNE